jgi:hypothetical protein
MSSLIWDVTIAALEKLGHWAFAQIPQDDPVSTLTTHKSVDRVSATIQRTVVSQGAALRDGAH